MYVGYREGTAMFPVTPAMCAGCAASDFGFCANLTRPVVERIAATSRLVRFRKGEQIGRGDAAPMSALIIRSGMIKISNTLADGRQQIIDLLTAGDLLIRDGTKTMDLTGIEATSNVDACETDLGRLNTLCAELPDLRDTLLAAIIGEIGRKNQQITMLGRRRSDERIASFLLDFSNRAMRRGDAPEQLRLPVSRAEIADYLSLTTETVSRAFSLLKEEGIVDLPKPHHVVILDLAALIEIAQGGGNLSVR